MTRASEGLEIAEPHLRHVLDSIPARIVLLNRAHRYEYVNRAYADFVGRSLDDIRGRPIETVIGPRAFDVLRPLYQSALDGHTTNWEGWVPYDQGRRFVQCVSFPYRGDQDSVEGAYLFLRDVTQFKSGEEMLVGQLAALTASEALNAAMTASALDCIVAIDESGLVLEFNPAAEQTFGYRRADAIGQPIVNLIVPPALRQRHADGFARYLRTGETTMLGRRIEIDGMRADGSTFPLELAINEVWMRKRRVFTAYLRDLTAARQAAAEIQRQREALHQSEKLSAMGSLLAGVAHELNNPLSIVVGNALMLHEEAEQTAPALAERAGRIKAAAERCGRIVRSFLAMARKRPTEPRLVSARDLVDSALQLLAYGLRASGVEIEQDIPANLPPFSCDADQVTQVLTNLLVNARQVLEEQPQPRRIRLAAQEVDGFMTISVADNGPGIPERIRSRVFEPFFTTKPQGTGIGLAVSRGIVEAHGGTLMASDDTAGGARFVLRLPLRNGVPGGPSPSPSTIVASASQRSALIVDDEADVGAVLSEMLRKEGYRCIVVTGGEAAIETLTQHDVDAIISDVRLPGIDGPALFAWLQANRSHLCSRMAFVTGDTLGTAAEGFLASSGRPVLQKPFLPGDVRRILEELALGRNP